MYRYDPTVWQDAGHNNWCSVLLDSNGLDFRVNRKASRISNFVDACDYTATMLYQDWAQYPLYLSLSGGADSELVADVFVRNNISFVPLILEIADINKTEAWYAHHWCYRNRIRPHVIKLQLDEFEQQVLPLIRHIKNTHSVGIIISLWIAEYVAKLNGKFITGLCDINFDQGKKQFFNDSLDWPIELFTDASHPCGFFCYTPEMAVSYVNQFDISKDEQYNKMEFYNIPLRPKIPYLYNLYLASKRITDVISNYHKHNIQPPQNWLGTKQDLIRLLYEL